MKSKPCKCGCGLLLFEHQRKNAEYRKSRNGDEDHYTEFHKREKREIYKAGKRRKKDIDQKHSNDIYNKRAKEFIKENGHCFFKAMDSKLDRILTIENPLVGKVSFRYLLDCMRYEHGFHFPNPIQEYLKEGFAKQHPESMRFIK